MSKPSSKSANPSQSVDKGSVGDIPKEPGTVLEERDQSAAIVVDGDAPVVDATQEQKTREFYKTRLEKNLEEGFDYKSFLAGLTKRPGVYQMYDAGGYILYVGKAKNLKNRVSSYFRKTGLTRKTQVLVSKIAAVNVTVTPSEAEALVLEHNLIKQQKPPFNIVYRDDKSFPYVLLTTGESYPRLAFHRGAKRKKGRYFGPYPSAGAVRESLNFLQKTFGVRQCEDSVFRNRSRPCLQHQIGRCSAPCVGQVSEEQYQRDLEHTALFLEGKSEQLHALLSQEMEAASRDLRFEEAASCRDKISKLRQIQSQFAMGSSRNTLDVIACDTRAGMACIHRLYVRQGRIIGSKSYFSKNSLEESSEEVLSTFIAHSYLGDTNMDVPASLAVSHDLPDCEALATALSQKHERQIAITTNVRALKAKWIAMALDTARQNLSAHLNDKASVKAKFAALKEVLDFDDEIHRIECFDISHSSGELTVGSCVVFNQEGALKSDYRKFNIDGITKGDDYAAMEQTLTRRYTRLLKESKPLPDLVLIDGGRGQLNKAIAVMDEVGVSGVQLVGVAKGTTRKPGFETLVFPEGHEQVIDSTHPALHLIQQIRDEAHRFAITGHKKRRDTARLTSTLEGIPGVGAKRRRELIRYFGGLQEVRKAGVEDLGKVPGISKSLAQEIYSHLNSE